MINGVLSVSFCGDDGIHFSFKQMPAILFSAWYIPPNDSLYYTSEIFAKLLSMLFNENREAVIFGDFNAKIKDFNETLNDKRYSYSTINGTRNVSGDLLRTICADDDLVVTNGLFGNDIRFDDLLTYKKKDKWISRLDLCLVSSKLVKSITSFKIIQDNQLPSDHAIITATFKMDVNIDPNATLKRATDLCIYNIPLKNSNRKKLSMAAFDLNKLQQNLKLLIPPEVDENTIDHCTSWLNNNIFHSTTDAMTKLTGPQWNTTEENRWNRLLEANDSRVIWNSINWSGKFGIHGNKEVPSPETFKYHFEDLLFTKEETSVDDIDISSSPYIPV